MFCQNCGKSLLENAKFCPECGTKVILETPNSTSEPIKIENDKVENEIILNGMSFDFEDIKRTYGNQKIEAIKYLRNAANSGLRETKEAFD
ncbi:MAG: zinc ribbon domain-containing protein, partial [Clostridia bacterium]